jgi:hypothetical protein
MIKARSVEISCQGIAHRTRHRFNLMAVLVMIDTDTQ